MQNFGNTYLASAIQRVVYYRQLAEKAFHQLKEADFYYSPAPHCNSIAIIMQHMAGNMLSRWTHFLTEDGEKEWRNRDMEFDLQWRTHEALMQLWEKGWDCFLGALEGLKEEDLLKTIYIRTEPLLVVDAINRQLSHYPYHVGQIIYLAKLMAADDWQSLTIEKGHSDAFNKHFSQQVNSETNDACKQEQSGRVSH